MYRPRWRRPGSRSGRPSARRWSGARGAGTPVTPHGVECQQCVRGRSAVPGPATRGLGSPARQCRMCSWFQQVPRYERLYSGLLRRCLQPHSTGVTSSPGWRGWPGHTASERRNRGRRAAGRERDSLAEAAPRIVAPTCRSRRSEETAVVMRTHPAGSRARRADRHPDRLGRPPPRSQGRDLHRPAPGVRQRRSRRVTPPAPGHRRADARVPRLAER